VGGTNRLSAEVRDSLLAASRGACSRAQLNVLVKVSHAMASAFLAGKSASLLLRSMHGLNVSDLAYDCIADLFARDDQGKLRQLEAYFSGLPAVSASDEELLIHLRRLVFSRVNHGVFRLCGEADPALAKILRNIKLAVATLKNFTETERFGEAHLRPSLCDALEEEPPFEPEELERRFLAVVTGNEMVPELLSRLSLLLREQTDRCRAVPLMAVGMLFRSVYEKKRLAPAEAVNADDTLVSADTEAIIRSACDAVKHKAREKYTASGKLSEAEYELYFHVIHDELCGKYLGGDGSKVSLFESMSRRMPGLGRDEYVRTHRNIVEYLLRLAQAEAEARLRAF
jgi:hypothetical protein